MKKKLLMIISSALLVTGFTTGCSLIESATNTVKDGYNSETMLKDMDRLVTQENKNDEILQQGVQKFEDANLDDPNLKPEQLKQAAQKLEEAKKKVDEYKTAVTKVQQDFTDVKAKAGKITDEKLKKLADQFTADFEISLKTELQFADKYNEFIQNNIEQINAVVAGKDIPKDNTEQLFNELDKLNKQLQDQVKKFNDSYNTISKEVTGQGIQDPNKK